MQTSSTRVVHHRGVEVAGAAGVDLLHRQVSFASRSASALPTMSPSMTATRELAARSGEQPLEERGLPRPGGAHHVQPRRCRASRASRGSRAATGVVVGQQPRLHVNQVHRTSPPGRRRRSTRTPSPAPSRCAPVSAPHGAAAEDVVGHRGALPAGVALHRERHALDLEPRPFDAGALAEGLEREVEGVGVHAGHLADPHDEPPHGAVRDALQVLFGDLYKVLGDPELRASGLRQVAPRGQLVHRQPGHLGERALRLPGSTLRPP